MEPIWKSIVSTLNESIEVMLLKFIWKYNWSMKIVGCDINSGGC